MTFVIFAFVVLECALRTDMYMCVCVRALVVMLIVVAALAV